MDREDPLVDGCVSSSLEKRLISIKKSPCALLEDKSALVRQHWGRTAIDLQKKEKKVFVLSQVTVSENKSKSVPRSSRSPL